MSHACSTLASIWEKCLMLCLNVTNSSENQRTSTNSNHSCGLPFIGRLLTIGRFRSPEYFYITSHLNGMCLDVDDADPTEGTRVAMWPKYDEPRDNQLWYEDRYGYLRSKLNDMVIDTKGQGSNRHDNRNTRRYFNRYLTSNPISNKGIMLQTKRRACDWRSCTPPVPVSAGYVTVTSSSTVTDRKRWLTLRRHETRREPSVWPTSSMAKLTSAGTSRWSSSESGSDSRLVSVVEGHMSCGNVY